MPLYRIETDQRVKQLKPSPFRKDRNLQKLIEDNLDTLLGVRYMASEFTTGDRQRGRIDILGIDQNDYPLYSV